MISDPTVGVIVVNHHGGELTMKCLRSLRETDWPSDRLQVVVVDNGSSDGIGERIARELPGTTVVDAGGNRGFAGGVNLGLRGLDAADYIALLNNDATVEPGWLRPLVAALAGDPSVGAACPKILFDGRFVDVDIAAATERGGLGDRRAVGVRISGARVDERDAWSQTQLVRGFWEEEHGADGEPTYRWTADAATLRLPVAAEGPRPCAHLRVAADRPKTVSLVSGLERVEEEVTPTPRWVSVPLAGPPADVINNAGSVLERGGYGADRGYLERDEGQYERGEEVFAWCGAAVLLSRRYVESVGTFDERFFLYYEDFDLSWRGRAQGWRYLYVPASKVRHVHTASSVEGSKLFQHYVERNRLLTLARNAPSGLATSAALRHLLVTASYTRRDIVSPMLHGRHPSRETVTRRLGAFGSYARLLPATVAERRRLRRRLMVPDRVLMEWTVPPRLTH